MDLHDIRNNDSIILRVFNITPYISIFIKGDEIKNA